MKKKIISTILVVILLITQISVLAKDYSDYPQRFWDVPKDHWAFGYISELVDKGVLNGYEDGSFRPDDTVTRAEWAKIMVLAAGLPVNDDAVNFYDMYDHWANSYVNTAKEYLAAYTDGTFKPDQAAVREDVTVSMVKLKGYDVSKVDYSYLSRFSDMNSISNSLKAYVAVAVEKELIDGFEDGTFRGQDTLTRAEAATLLWRAFQYGSDNKVVDTPSTPVTTPTPEPTQKPEEAKPTETPKPTPKPTETPEATEEPEPAPTPTPKPYKVDTLTKVDGSFVDYVTDYQDNIYYTNGDKVVKVDIYSKEDEEIFNAEAIAIDNDEYTLDDFKITNLCYDEYQDRLLVQGKYKEVNSAKEMNNGYLYEIKNGDIEVITDSFPKYGEIMGVLNNGDYVTYYGNVLDSHTFSEKCELDGEIKCVIEIDDCIYYINYLYRSGDYLYHPDATCTYDFMRYDYVNNSSIFKIIDKADSFKMEHFPYVNATMSNKHILGRDYNDLYFYNFKGKEINKLSMKKDCIVVDKTPINNDLSIQLLLTDNDDIIFYDESAKTIRMISEND